MNTQEIVQATGYLKTITFIMIGMSISGLLFLFYLVASMNSKERNGK